MNRHLEFIISKLFATLLVLGCYIPCAWAGVTYGVNGGQAENVTIVNLEDRDGMVILTFSGPVLGGPACAAQHRNVLVIAHAKHSLDAVHARRAFALGQAVNVWGGSTCADVSGYETLSVLEVVR